MGCDRPKRTEALIGDIPVHVISAEHLIQNQLASGRFQDLPDAEAVREATNE
jgi:hypothetical protein